MNEQELEIQKALGTVRCYRVDYTIHYPQCGAHYVDRRVTLFFHGISKEDAKEKTINDVLKYNHLLNRNQIEITNVS